MEKTAVAEHFGNQSEVARALGITRQAVSAWPEIIPELYALRIEKLTNGKLRYDEKYYRS